MSPRNSEKQAIWFWAGKAWKEHLDDFFFGPTTCAVDPVGPPLDDVRGVIDLEVRGLEKIGTVDGRGIGTTCESGSLCSQHPSLEFFAFWVVVGWRGGPSRHLLVVVV